MPSFTASTVIVSALSAIIQCNCATGNLLLNCSFKILVFSTNLRASFAVAQFSNAAGLEKMGDNCYTTTLNSGEFDGIGVDISANGGYMETGVLEMSNVDLSAEFTDMITAQRGFQANSRIITVSDTLLEELVNLKR